MGLLVVSNSWLSDRGGNTQSVYGLETPIAVPQPQLIMYTDVH